MYFQILSQYDISDAVSNTSKDKHIQKQIQQSHHDDSNIIKNDYFVPEKNITEPEEILCKRRSKESVSSKQSKRKMINSLFDHKSKRKFPGPAGLLTGTIEENYENICQIELLSQVKFTILAVLHEL